MTGLKMLPGIRGGILACKFTLEIFEITRDGYHGGIIGGEGKFGDVHVPAVFSYNFV